MTIIVIYKFEMRNIKICIYDYGGILLPSLVRYYVDLSDLYFVLSDLYVDLSDLNVDLSLIPSVEK